MAKKCALCGEELKTTFLDKIDGTFIKTGNGKTLKQHVVCSTCQKEHKDTLKEKLE